MTPSGVPAGTVLGNWQSAGPSAMEAACLASCLHLQRCPVTEVTRYPCHGHQQVGESAPVCWEPDVTWPHCHSRAQCEGEALRALGPELPLSSRPTPCSHPVARAWGPGTQRVGSGSTGTLLCRTHAFSSNSGPRGGETAGGPNSSFTKALGLRGRCPVDGAEPSVSIWCPLQAEHLSPTPPRAASPLCTEQGLCPCPLSTSPPPWASFPGSA